MKMKTRQDHEMIHPDDERDIRNMTHLELERLLRCVFDEVDSRLDTRPEYKENLGEDGYQIEDGFEGMEGVIRYIHEQLPHISYDT